MSADLWAGAEVQVAALSSYLAEQPGILLSAVLMNEGRLARELRGLGIDVAVVDERQHTAIGILVFLRRFLKDRRIDLVHTHRYKDTMLGILAAKLSGVPHVIRTVHGLAEPMAGWSRAKSWCYEALDRVILRYFANRVIAVSGRMAATLRASGYGTCSVTAIHNGLHVGRVRAFRSRDDLRRELGIEPGAFVIGTAGRLSPVKAQALLLHAGVRIVLQRPDAHFLIVGNGPLRGELVSLAVTLGIGSRTVFAGERSDVHDLIAAMDVFVLPSLNEGIPMALLEAMALRRPVVATAVGGVPEVVQDRSSGLLVPSGDEQALASACLELAGNPELAHALGVAACWGVERSFSRDANGAAVLDTYHAVAGTRVKTRDARPGTWTICRELVTALPVYAWSRGRDAVDGWRERRRMARIRRQPESVTDALRCAARVLIVCQGNIIRSPFAASLVSRGLADSHVTVVSAGLAATAGNPPHPRALHLASTRSVDLSAHAASPLTSEAVEASDAIFVMDVPQLVMMRRRFPEARARTFLLTCLAPETPLEVRDPYAGDESQFHECFEHIARAVGPIVHALSGSRP